LGGGWNWGRAGEYCICIDFCSGFGICSGIVAFGDQNLGENVEIIAGRVAIGIVTVVRILVLVIVVGGCGMGVFFGGVFFGMIAGERSVLRDFVNVDTVGDGCIVAATFKD
jgi:hypothetical protein